MATMTSWRNLADWDRVLRIVLGLVFLGLGLSGAVNGLGGVALVIFGWMPLLTGILGWDPIYALLGARTLRS
jgi:hypothetical protein